jgi:thiamine-monophosphate kinase
VDGFVDLARTAGAPLVGGNLTRSPGPVVLDVTAVGGAGRRRILRRSTASRGDELYVTGSVGAAAAGLAMLAAGIGRASMDGAALDCVARYEMPDARMQCGRIVGRSRAAAAAIDLSDGLADAAIRLARDSGLGVVVDAALVPIHDGARRWADQSGGDAVMLAVTGGEDYELAFAVRPRLRTRFLAAVRRVRGLPVTRVGVFTQEPGAWLDRAGEKTPLRAGFSHF